MVDHEYSTNICKPLNISFGMVMKNSEMLKFIPNHLNPDCYKNSKVCDKAVDNYSHALKFVPNYYITQNMCDKAINTYHSTIQFVPDCSKTKEMCNRTISEYLFMLVYCPDKYKTQRICDEAVDDCLGALKVIPDWFVTSKMIKNRLTVLYADGNVLYFYEDSGNAVFSCNEMGILNPFMPGGKKMLYIPKQTCS